MPEAGVMVEYSSYAVFDGINVGGVSGKLRLLQRQVPVNGPPLPVQDIQESLWVITFDTQPSGKSAVDVLVGVDKRRHDHSAFCVDELCVRISFPDLFRSRSEERRVGKDVW